MVEQLAVNQLVNSSILLSPPFFTKALDSKIKFIRMHIVLISIYLLHLMSIKNYFIGFSRTSFNESYFSKYYKIGIILVLCGGLIFILNESVLNTLYAAELKPRNISISGTQLLQLVKVNLNLKDTYYFEYYKIAIFMLLTILICSLLIIIAYLFSLTTVKDSEKLSEYECGFEPFDNATRHPFDVHFYIVGILFLIFDVEIALIFP